MNAYFCKMTEFRFTRPSPFPPIIKNLIIINLLVWVAQMVFQDSYQLTNRIALYPIDSPWFEPYQIATHMFAHAIQPPGFPMHIIFNMFTLWMFGRTLENYWGPKRFLFFYLACGVGAAAVHLLVQHLQYDPQLIRELTIARLTGNEALYDQLITQAKFLSSALGASGAVMGVVIGFAYLFPNTEFFLLFFPFPIKAKWVALGLVAMDLFGGFNPTSDSGIAHFAHLGGALTGFIIVLIWNKTNKKTFY
jgi:membrane associated rhomboid family serine protease